MGSLPVTPGGGAGRFLAARPRASAIGLAALAGLVGIAVYLPTLGHGFLHWDDAEYVWQNPFLGQRFFRFVAWSFTTFHASNWHPLTWLSLGLDHALCGLQPAGYHLTNVLLHGANSLLVVLLAGRLFIVPCNRSQLAELTRLDAAGCVAPPLRISNTRRSSTPCHRRQIARISQADFCYTALAARGTLTPAGHAAAFVAGLVFAVHPLHVESVAWVSERKDLLYAFFWLLGVLVYLEYAGASTRKRRFAALATVTGLFALSLASKPMAVSLPFVLLLFDWYPLGRLRRGSLVRVLVWEKLPLYALAAFTALLTIEAQARAASIVSSDTLPAAERVSLAIHSLVFYVEKFFVPAGLAPFYPLPRELGLMHPRHLIPLGFLAALTVLAFRSRRRHPILLAAWAFLLVTLAPTLGVVKVGEQATADRYMYVPLLALAFPLALAAAAAARRVGSVWRPGRAAAALVVAGACTVLAVLAVRQTRYWRDSLTLWDRGIAVHPEHPKPYLERGFVLESSGLLDAAIADYEKAIALDPRYHRAHNNLGTALVRRGDPARAIECFDAAIRLEPREARPYYNRGQALWQLGRRREAVRSYREAAARGHALAQERLARLERGH